MSDPLLTELQTLDRTDLKARWVACFGQPPPEGFYVGRLIQGIAYHEQVRADPDLERLAQQMHRRLRLAASTGSLPKHVRLHPGARLLREWNGASHEVTVTDGAFIYRERAYQSLSAIAPSPMIREREAADQ